MIGAREVGSGLGPPIRRLVDEAALALPAIGVKSKFERAVDQ